MKEFSLFEKISAALVGLAGLLYVITYVVALAGDPRYGTPTGVFVVNGIGNLSLCFTNIYSINICCC